MAEEKIKLKYYFENPNNPQVVVQELKKILLDKLKYTATVALHKAN